MSSKNDCDCGRCADCDFKDCADPVGERIWADAGFQRRWAALTPTKLQQLQSYADNRDREKEMLCDTLTRIKAIARNPFPLNKGCVALEADLEAIDDESTCMLEHMGKDEEEGFWDTPNNSLSDSDSD